MKTFNELFREIAGSDELKKAYETAVKSGGEAVEKFLKAHGCDGTMEDIVNFFKEQQAEEELTDAEIAGVAGGLQTGIPTEDIDAALSSCMPWECNPNYSAADSWKTICA